MKSHIQCKSIHAVGLGAGNVGIKIAGYDGLDIRVQGAKRGAEEASSYQQTAPDFWASSDTSCSLFPSLPPSHTQTDCVPLLKQKTQTDTCTYRTCSYTSVLVPQVEARLYRLDQAESEWIHMWRSFSSYLYSYYIHLSASWRGTVPENPWRKAARTRMCQVHDVLTEKHQQILSFLILHLFVWQLCMGKRVFTDAEASLNTPIRTQQQHH